MKRISRRGVLAALGVGAVGTVALTGCASLQAVGSQGTSSASAGGVTNGYLAADSLHSVEKLVPAGNLRRHRTTAVAVAGAIRQVRRRREPRGYDPHGDPRRCDDLRPE